MARKTGIMAPLLLLSVLVWATLTLLTLTSSISAAALQRDALRLEERELESSIAALRAAGNDSAALERAAREELGMVYIGEEIFY